VLSVSHLFKGFSGLEVLEDFSLQVPRNGFTALVGPSGCGKSTFFDVLTGVEGKDKGEILWLGEPMDNLGKKAAYMQQKDLLLPWLSLLDNALLPTRINGQNPQESKEKALEHFRRLGLGGFESYPPQKVSGGMRQRCALVRTLMFEQELVLLDEPLSALDAITRRSLQALLLLLQSEFKKTILMITHDVEEALLVADEVLVLTQLPMRIQERFHPSMPKPRKGSDPELIQIKEHILEELQGELKDEPL
jgi:putative hydroxymethylpyrimidine transport system ATP-binding protein